MHRTWRVIACLALLGLAACGDSSRPVYSGHQESTEGVPGFSEGKKLSPYVKLGQSYRVNGKTYVPRYQPDYNEVGLASWYGPGFHGGKTANGEYFDKHAMTAAHKTLPLPSIVRVTMLSTGKSALVRINDRGPFANDRLIDLSYGAAQEIGLMGKGVAQVRVEYLPQETERFVALLSQGRSPEGIDLAELSTPVAAPVRVASAAPPAAKPAPQHWYDVLNPVSSAQAQEAAPPLDTSAPAPVSEETNAAAPGESISSQDLTAPAASPVASPAKAAAPASAAPTPTTPANPPAAAPAAPAVKAGPSLQLGAFTNPENAERLAERASKFGPVNVVSSASASGAPLYRVRLGPFAAKEEATKAADSLRQLGIDAQLIE